MLTKLNVWNGHENISVRHNMVLEMLCGRMKARYNWKHISDTVIGRWDKLLKVNQGYEYLQIAIFISAYNIHI